MGVPGVADVTVYGGEVEEYQIRVKPEAMVRYGLSLKDVLSAARRATGVRGAGYIENSNQRIILRSKGQIRSIGELSRVILKYKNGIGVNLGDVAEVVRASAPFIGGALIAGKPAVILRITEQYGADTRTVTRSAEMAVGALKPMLESQGIVLHPDIFRLASFIRTAIDHLQSALLAGGILVISVLMVFLFNLRTAIISVLAIPLSFFTAILILHALSVELNIMALAGLAIALGEVVDDAIVDVENIFRRLSPSFDFLILSY